MTRNVFNPAQRQAPGARVVADQPAGSMARTADEDISDLMLNPGEGGPVADSPAGGAPIITWPDPNDTNADDGISDLMLNPGEGGPVAPSPNEFIPSAPSAPTFPVPSRPPVSAPSRPPVSTPSRPPVVTPTLPNPNGPGSAPVITIRPGTSSGPSSGSQGTGVVIGHQHWNCNNSGNCSTIVGSVINTSQQRATVRFLNAAYGYRPFRIFISNTLVVNLLNFASASSYTQAYIGYQTITVSGTDGYIYIQKTIPFMANTVSTIAIINSSTGLDLLHITDSCCPPTNGYSSFRIGNLAYNTNPLDVLMSDGRVVYSDLRNKEIGTFKRIMPGAYQFFYAETNLLPMPSYMDIETMDSAWLGVYPNHETFGSLHLNVVSNAIYSVYLLQSGSGRNQVQNLVLMDR